MEYTQSDRASSKSLVKKIPILIVGLALIVGGVTVYKTINANTTQTEAPIQTMPEVKTVTALGRLEPAGEIVEVSVSSGAQGNRIDELLVKEGDKIKKGQTIAILDSRDRLEAALNQSQEQVGMARANLNLVKAGAKTGEIKAQQAAIAKIEAERNNNIIAQQATVSRIKAELNNAQIEYRRYEQLYNDGAISASEKDSRYLTLTTTKEQLAEAQANLKRIESSQQEQIAQAKATLNQIAEVRPVDLAVAQAEVRQAQAAVKTARAELDRAYIKSPQAGTVIKTMVRPGEIVNDGGIARIGQIDRMYAVAEIYQSDINKIEVGQSVTVTSSAIDGKLQGEVERVGLEIERQNVVNTDPTANIDARVVEVKVKLDETSSQKVAGLTNLQVNVRIEI